MSLELDREKLLDSDILLQKVIKDLETGAEYPYRDIKSAARVLHRIAKIDSCPVTNVLETIWIHGCTLEEFKQIKQIAKAD